MSRKPGPVERRFNLESLVKLPSVNIIMGKRGSGKSALAYFLLDKLSKKHNLTPCVYAFPQERRHLLPDHYQLCYDFNFPTHSIVFLDEISFFAHARRTANDVNLELDRLLSKARHKKWIIILASHHSSKIDVAIIREADNLLIKQPSRLERDYGARKGIIQNITEKAYTIFNNPQLPGDRRFYVYFVSEEYEGLLFNTKAPFWTEDLSHTTVGENSHLTGS